MTRLPPPLRNRFQRFGATGPGLVRPSERLFCLRAVAHFLPDEVLDDEQLHCTILRCAQLQPEESATAAEIRALAQAALADGSVERAAKGDVVYSNIAHLQTLAGLEQLDCDLLAIAVAAQSRSGVNACLGWLFGGGGTCPHREIFALLAAMAQSSPEAVEAALADDALLTSSRLLQIEYSNGTDRCLSLLDECERALQRPGLSQEGLLAQFLASAPPPELELADYAHIQGDVANLHKLLAYALEHHTPGLNVLIHGAPGTGKTQLARVLAKNLGVSLFEARQGEENMLERASRLRNLMLCQALLKRQPRALALFDEVEDAFPQEVVLGLPLVHSPKRRAVHHQLLESNAAPVIWIANTVSHLDPALLRRFLVVVEVSEPPRATRLRMLAKALGEHAVSPQWLDRAADDPSLTPADIARASLVAKALAGDQLPVEQALDWALRGHQALRHRHDRSSYRLDRASYDLQFVNADKDLVAVVQRLAVRPRATMCLSGPPGTGKTAFCAHLANVLGVPLIHAKASDLLDKFVGETEKRIARLFRTAKDQGAVLLLDEADGLLRDRRSAVHTWELTQVNEILCQMEAFDGVFVCATNLPGELDAATLRRFHVKIAFKPLRDEQLLPAFRRVLEASRGAPCEVDPAALQVLSTLTGVCLGDLHAARRHCEIVADQPTALDMALAVAEEVAARSGPRRAAGFRAA